MIGIDHLTVAYLFPLIIHIKTVSIFHDEFTGTHHPETGPNLIPELGLNLIEVDGHLAVGTDLPACDIRDYLFMSRPKTTVSIVAILEPGPLFSILFPLIARDFRLGRKLLQGRKKIFRIPHLNSSFKTC